ncbi:MAG TPA: haloacid dehalogenase type II [Phycisphaerales bacterium]|nr:haloacid dehalogenase type II [Phycisphaerales bacterium]
MISLAGITHITFDCYGTLIDWEAGILKAIRPILSIHGRRPSDDEVLELYARVESSIEAGPYMPYRDVLRETMAAIGLHYGLSLEEKELERLPASVAQWPPFADTVEALALLARHCTLTIVSNIDEDLFEGSRVRLEGGGGEESSRVIDRLVSAELCRSYKPHPRHFKVALALMDVPPQCVLHVAQSLYHDIVPARELGLRTAWINRRHDKAGAGATPRVAPEIRHDLEFKDLASLARQIERDKSA